ncbi:MAG: hypothetical protein US76_03535 [Parcubacteria group bacterium GW2011_GWA2_38_13b]|nr:MAG: hypothetical protein US76_03535 [Parcubacteria group bacterium GW2011_GWA2_38_13b]
MIYLNLSPLFEKKIFKFACVEKMVNYYIVVVLTAVVCLTFAFMGVKHFLLLYADISQRSVAKQKTEELARAIQDMEMIIRDFNAVIDTVDKIERKKIEFSDILADLSDIISESIIVSNLSYSFFSGNIDIFVLEGKSGTREEFLAFTERLDQSPHFKEINSPLSNVMKKENINFRIEFKLEI